MSRRTVLKRSADLSRKHTPKLGTRSLDVLHVASALELGMKRFVTFDEPQGRLASAVGLKVAVPAG
jgi:predicted nucleic acid-binding protein